MKHAQRLRTAALILAGTLGLGLAIASESGACSERSGQRAAHQSSHTQGAGHAQRLQSLHDKLKLNPEQTKAWESFAGNMGPMGGKKGQSAQHDSGNAIARMESRMQQLEALKAQMSSRLQAMKSFYAALTPEQQKIFDGEMNHERKGQSGKKGMKHGQGASHSHDGVKG
jgi:hypothetical protein